MELHGHGTTDAASTPPNAKRRDYAGLPSSSADVDKDRRRTSKDQLLPSTTDDGTSGVPPPPSVPDYNSPDIVVGAAETITIDEAVDALGTGPFQLRILFAAGLCFAADSMEIMLLSFLSGILRDEWGLTANQAATITSCVFAGSMLGTLTLGHLGDLVGRRPVFLACGVIISVFGVATAFAGGYLSLLATRFLVGFGVGGLTVPFDILSEFLPTKTRGRYLLLIEFFWTFGSMAVPIVAYLTIGLGQSWQLFVLICAIPCLASFIIGVLAVPESPRWLLAEGRKEEAMNILKDAAAVNKKDIDVLFPKGTELEDDDEEESGRYADLFVPKWRKITLLLWGVWVGFAFGYYGTIIAVTRVFESEEDAGRNDDNDITNVNFDYSAIFISSMAEFVGTALMIIVVERVGRISMQVSAYTIGGILLFLLCFFSQSGNRPFLVAVSFGARVCEMIGSCVTWVTTAEVLTTEIRTTGHSAANAVARLGGFFSPYLVGGNLSLRNVGFIMLAIHGFTALCASRLPETKGKKLGHALSVVGESESAHAYRETELSAQIHGAARAIHPQGHLT